MREIQFQKKEPTGYVYHSLYSAFILEDFSILIDRPIDNDMASEVILTLRLLHKTDSEKPITIYINSPGGSVSAGMAIFDYCAAISNPIHTVGLGLCASMGAFLLICLGQVRKVGENCEIMLHQPLVTGMGPGKATDVEIAARQLLKTREKINAHLAKHSHLNEKEIEELSDSDKWLTAADALKLGFIDGFYRT